MPNTIDVTHPEPERTALEHRARAEFACHRRLSVFPHLTDADIDAELAAYNAERRERGPAD